MSELMPEQLKNYIISQPTERRMDLLADKQIRTLFLTDIHYHYPFVWLVQELGDSSIKYLIDNDFINQLLSLSSVRVDDKLNAIITCGNPSVNECLNNEAIYEYLSESDSLKTFFSSLNIVFCKPFFDYLLTNNPNLVRDIVYFNDEVQESILTDETIKKILDLGINIYFIPNLKLKTMAKMVNNPLLSDVLINYFPEEIEQIVKQGVSLPFSLQNNETIINKFLTITNVDNYRFILNNLAISNQELFDQIQKRRRKYYDAYVESINPKEPLLTNLDHVNIKSEAKSLDYFIQILIDRYFEDIAYNFYVNLKEMLNYLKDIKEELLTKEKLELYKMIYNYKKYSLEELINLYQSMNNGTNYVEEFYDDYQSVKYHAIEDINAQSIKQSDINSKPSFVIKGVNVLELKGEPFISLAHVTRGFARNFTNTTSLSLIGDKHIGFFHNNSEAIKIGFDSVPKDQVMHVYDDDSYSINEYGTRRIYQIKTPERLLNDTIKYNEILISQKNNRTDGNYSDDKKYVKASYLISINEISSEELKLASEYNIPILLIHKEFYLKSKVSRNVEENDYSDEISRIQLG